MHDALPHRVHRPGRAAVVLGPDHSATRAFARASTTMAKADLWQARLALRTLRLEVRQAIAEAAES